MYHTRLLAEFQLLQTAGVVSRLQQCIKFNLHSAQQSEQLKLLEHWSELGPSRGIRRVGQPELSCLPQPCHAHCQEAVPRGSGLHRRSTPMSSHRLHQPQPLLRRLQWQLGHQRCLLARALRTAVAMAVVLMRSASVLVVGQVKHVTFSHVSMAAMAVVHA